MRSSNASRPRSPDCVSGSSTNSPASLRRDGCRTRTSTSTTTTAGLGFRGDGVGRRDVLDHAQRLAGRSFDKDRPLWELCVIEGLPGKRAAFVMKVHHAIADGLGLVQLLAQMVDLEADPTEMRRTRRVLGPPRASCRLAAVVDPGRPLAQPSDRQRGEDRSTARPGLAANRRRAVARPGAAPSSSSGARPARSPGSSSRRPRRSAR